MKVKQQRHLCDRSQTALRRALPYANFTWADVREIMAGNDPDTKHWMIWNVGNLCWVFTIINWMDEVEVLLCGGQRVRECLPHWEAAITQDPLHKGKPVCANGRKGWQRILPHWERREDGLYLKVI
jgi:hypothetical protein